MSGRCMYVEIDGEQIRVQWAGPMKPEDALALAEIVRAAKRQMQQQRDAIGEHEHQWKSPFKDGRMAFCTVCRDRQPGGAG